MINNKFVSGALIRVDTVYIWAINRLGICFARKYYVIYHDVWAIGSISGHIHLPRGTCRFVYTYILPVTTS